MVFPQRLKQRIIVFCMVLFFGYGLFTLGAELQTTFHTFQTFSDLNEHETRTLLLGDVYQFAARCNQIIPGGANVLFLTSSKSNKQSADLFINYFMYPRKLFLLNNISPYPEVPPTLKELHLRELSQKGIEWIAFRYPEYNGLNRVLQVNNGRAVATYELDAETGKNK
jgi:hypothetical protein